MGRTGWLWAFPGREYVVMASTVQMAVAAGRERKVTAVELAARRLELASARLARTLERLAAQGKRRTA